MLSLCFSHASRQAGVERICKQSASERKELLEQMHLLSSWLGKAIGTVELLTSQIAGTLWKRKKKKSNAPSSSKQRFCAVRVDGLHYYTAEGGERRGVIERARIEDCVLLENGKTFDMDRILSLLSEYNNIPELMDIIGGAEALR